MPVYRLDMAAASGSFHARCGLNPHDIGGAPSIRIAAHMEWGATNMAWIKER
ncbi:hypothetical protein [Methylobacterium sp. R2-1]|uniref:hypothetical protein n=1 Tax=Methylobacterium sp. R2-1 TaxID=2587064 RepID=UPI0016196483|nr:hypothetical protein [Methylobacterium sp. R2-1]MBB2961899.1 hypothetical protein [Methylobacterium sp. R2-1]